MRPKMRTREHGISSMHMLKLRMSRSYVRPGIVSHNAAISACETGQWERALCALHGKPVLHMDMPDPLR